MGILQAIRDGEFPTALNSKDYSKEEQIAGVSALLHQRLIVIKKQGNSTTGRGDGFVLQEESLQAMPEHAELTLEGERFVDQKRRIDTGRLETEAKIALLETLSKGPVHTFSNTNLPEGIGPHRKAFLIQDILQSKLAWIDYKQVQQGFYTKEVGFIRITSAGALELAKAKTEPGILEALFRNAQRQLLLNALYYSAPAL